MNEELLYWYWDDIPYGKANAKDYDFFCDLWELSERNVRRIFHELSCYDNGDNYILIRSAKGKGFYKTDDMKTIKAYKKECMHRGKSILAQVKKINRVLVVDDMQYSIENNLRLMREAAGLTQKYVCSQMQKYDSQFDIPLLSKMENNFCLPTSYQLAHLSILYDCEPWQLTQMYIR